MGYTKERAIIVIVIIIAATAAYGSVERQLPTKIVVIL
jgi:hypothetical protein